MCVQEKELGGFLKRKHSGLQKRPVDAAKAFGTTSDKCFRLAYRCTLELKITSAAQLGLVTLSACAVVYLGIPHQLSLLCLLQQTQAQRP